MLAPSDLQEYTGLSTTSILQRQHLKLDVGAELIKWHVEGMYGSVDLGRDPDGLPTMRVRQLFSTKAELKALYADAYLLGQIMKTVDLKQRSEREFVMEWAGGSTNDMVADSVLALLMGIDTSPASAKSKWSFLYTLGECFCVLTERIPPL